MIQNDIIEQHPVSQPSPWISNVAIASKGDGDIRITLDSKKVNQAILSSNLPIPRQEDSKAKMSNCKLFSKMDLKSAYWKIQLHEVYRYLPVFYVDDKLYRYKRLSMGLSPAQGKLNAALRPLFVAIPGAHIIHDDLIIATETEP